MPVDQVTRAIYRATLRAACKLDTRPALQALIHRNRGRSLPDDFNSVLSVFLGGHHRHFYIPSLLPGPTASQTVKDAFRFPPGPPNIDAGLMGMRFLHGICQIAEKHGLLPESNPAANPRELTVQAAIGQSASQVTLQAVPEQGCILVSHPLLRNAYSSYFHQTVVLLCRHSFASGTYGLFLNRFLSANAKAKVDRVMQRYGSKPPQQAAGSSSGLDLARDMPAALHAMLGELSRNQVTAAVAAADDSANQSSDEDEDGDVSYLLEDPAETTIDVSFTSSAPASEPDQPLDDDGKAHLPSSDQGAAEQPEVSSSDQVGRKHQNPESKLWQATIKRSPSVQAHDEPAAPATADPQDIADPKHPLRFHQFITNMKRSTPSPLLPGAQDSCEPGPSPEADTHAALSNQQAQAAQPSDLQSPTGQTPSDQIPNDETSSSTSRDAGTRDSDSESATGQYQSLYRDLAESMPPDETSRTLSRGGPVPGSQVLHSSPELGGDAVLEACGDHPGVYVGHVNELLMTSRVGNERPQQAFPELQHPGCDQGRAQEVLSGGKPSDAIMRFFVGEAQWSSQQLESELAQGSWLLLAPAPQLLHDMTLKPYTFFEGYKGSDEQSRKMYINWRLQQIRQPAEEGSPAADLTSDDQLANVVSDLDQKVMSEVNRDILREHMWQETMVRAGKPFADLINIPTQLVKELMDLKY